MHRKERLTHPLSKISGYARAAMRYVYVLFDSGITDYDMEQLLQAVMTCYY